MPIACKQVGNLPRNTRIVPTHCKVVIGLANKMMEAKMVKNLRVVVTIEQVKGPKYTTVMKIKLCSKEKMKMHSQVRNAHVDLDELLLFVVL